MSGAGDVCCAVGVIRAGETGKERKKDEPETSGELDVDVA